MDKHKQLLLSFTFALQARDFEKAAHFAARLPWAQRMLAEERLARAKAS